jgi:hypothetical protein
MRRNDLVFDPNGIWGDPAERLQASPPAAKRDKHAHQRVLTSEDPALSASDRLWRPDTCLAGTLLTPQGKRDFRGAPPR